MISLALENEKSDEYIIEKLKSMENFDLWEAFRSSSAFGYIGVLEWLYENHDISDALMHHGCDGALDTFGENLDKKSRKCVKWFYKKNKKLVEKLTKDSSISSDLFE